MGPLTLISLALSVYCVIAAPGVVYPDPTATSTTPCPGPYPIVTCGEFSHLVDYIDKHGCTMYRCSEPLLPTVTSVQTDPPTTATAEGPTPTREIARCPEISLHCGLNGFAVVTHHDENGCPVSECAKTDLHMDCPENYPFCGDDGYAVVTHHDENGCPVSECTKTDLELNCPENYPFCGDDGYAVVTHHDENGCPVSECAKTDLHVNCPENYPYCGENGRVVVTHHDENGCPVPECTEDA